MRVPPAERLTYHPAWRASPSRMPFARWCEVIRRILIEELRMTRQCAEMATDVRKNQQTLYIFYSSGFSAIAAARSFFDTWLEIILTTRCS